MNQEPEQAEDVAVLSARIRASLHQKVRIKAIQEGRSLVGLVEEWAEAYVAAPTARPVAEGAH